LRLDRGFYDLALLAVVGGYGLLAIIQRLAARRRTIRLVVIVTTISLVLFSALVLHYEQSLNPPMSSATYGASLYLAEENSGATLICNDRTTCNQIAAVGGVRSVATAGGATDEPGRAMLRLVV